MALKAVQLPSSLVRPINNFNNSSLAIFCKVPGRLNVGIAAKHQKSSTPVLKCRANLRDCQNEFVQSQKDHLTEIPLVPYPSVLFPGATFQLQTFEFRYRIMMHTLLEEGLKFGIIYSGKNSRMADVGCIVHVVECERLVDDRFFLTCVGGDRFRVIDVVRTKPYVVAKIQVFNDRPNVEEYDLQSLAQKVENHIKSITRLSNKLNWKLRSDQTELLHGLHSPASFSFFVARSFIDDPGEQQALLQMDDAAQRLLKERHYLEHRSKHLAAIAAIEDALRHLSCNEK